MYKKLRTLIAILVFTALSISLVYADNGSRKTAAQEMRGVWVASVVNIDYPKLKTTNPLFLKREADLMIDQAYDAGMNAIFLQVRPTSDALYKSEIFPWSKWLTGKEGLAPDDGFDPLQYFIEKCHAKNIEVHAWLNPYRITKRLNGESVPSTDSLSETNPARLHPDWVVPHGGNLYYDPALPEVRKLIADGAAEIVKNYDIDGIHFDDYFYPGTDFDDAASYKKYGGGMPKDDWRRANVNAMVKEVRAAIKTLDSSVSFGISPFGIWANEKNNPLGSKTSGNQSYSSHYADSYYWVKNGLIDYINPQIYWHRGFEIADYNVLTQWWANLVKGTDVKLYIGHAAYKSGSSDSESQWHGPYEILEQVLYNKNVPEVDGSIFFSMRSLQQQPELRMRLGLIYGAMSYYDYGREKGILLPHKDVTTSMTYRYIGGLSDPTKPLFVNGKEIKNRSVNGFFGLLIDLKVGVNEIVMKNGDFTFVRKITRDPDYYGSSGTPSYLDSAVIVQDSCYPKKQAVIRDTNSIDLECIAPSGASIFAEVAGHKIPMKRVWGGSTPSLRKAKYRGNFKPLQYFNHVEMYDYGKISYHMYYDGKTSETSSNASLLYVAKRAKFYAKVSDEEGVDLTIAPDSSQGSAEILPYGTIEELTSSDGDILLLASGRYAPADDFEVLFGLNDSLHKVSFLEYKIGEKEDAIVFGLEDKYAIIPHFYGKELKVEIAGAGGMQAIAVPANALIGSSKAEIVNSRGYYTLNVKDPSEFNGAYVTYEDGKGILHLRRRPKLSKGDKPLDGIRILLDPGHGQSDFGAIGLLGDAYAEKHYNLNACEQLKSKLENYGAVVSMTRTDDSYVSLYDRLRQSYAEKPDMFISIHANSIGMHRDINYIDGFSVYYAKPVAKEFADIMQREVVQKLGRVDRRVLRDDFYVIRGDWAPSILIEAGFMPNPSDMDWLANKKMQSRFIDQLVHSILIYFSHGGR